MSKPKICIGDAMVDELFHAYKEMLLPLATKPR